MLSIFLMKTFPLSSVTEKSLKQESVLQEEVNSSQGTDGETRSHEAEEAPIVVKASPVVYYTILASIN